MVIPFSDSKLKQYSGINAHVKCELKISPMCAGVKHKKLNRSGSIVSLDSRRMSVVSAITSDSCMYRNVDVHFERFSTYSGTGNRIYCKSVV